MGINSTKKETQKSAEKQLDLKISLEDKLVEDLKTFFDQLSEDYRVVYSTSGKVLAMNESYDKELTALLMKNYREVAKNFNSETQKAIDEYIDYDVFELVEEAENDLRDKVALALGIYLLTRSKTIIPKISKTTQDTLINKTNEFIIEQASLGNAVKNAEIANEVSKRIKDWGEKHAKIIATTEIENIAEKSKQVENSTIKGVVKTEQDRIKNGGAVIKGKTYQELTKEEIKDTKELEKIANTLDIQKGSKKTWITAGDERVRESHAVLDGKTIEQDELFLTGNGSQMLYAGDMTNGATLSDVINCRCTVVYKYNTEIIKLYRNTLYRRK